MPAEWDSKVRTLKRAADAFGGAENLAIYLNVTAAEISDWIAGRVEPPNEIFRQALDIVAAGPFIARLASQQFAVALRRRAHAEQLQDIADRIKASAERAQRIADHARRSADQCTGLEQNGSTPANEKNEQDAKLGTTASSPKLSHDES
jgi:hypothetical protein